MPTVIVSGVTTDENAETHILEWGAVIPSREALGLWVVGQKMWKVFTSNQQCARLKGDLFRAEQYGLPIGPTRITPCRVRLPVRDVLGNFTEQHSLQSHEGFVLITNHFQGRHFTLQRGVGVFRHLILQISNDEVLKRIDRACSAAVAVGLRDPQGFINPTNYNPIVFIDIHLSRGGTTQASQDMLVITQNRMASVRNHT
ncbi:hypothetical protein BD410DRAFT_806015 [Rickenella mellea]|uniref:Uncharacterized protein n=1 Tax=Rickenella mellea TaxID=50990 RepID=A0A4Y7PVJ9_9AGAM|nr:hypothetical protein BD410DRAFT_806015 [Rickenella mellea]